MKKSFLMTILMLILCIFVSCSNKDVVEDDSEKYPKIGEASLNNFTIYSADLATEVLNPIAKAINDKYSLTIPIVNEQKDNQIIISLDSSISPLKYSVSVEGNCLLVKANNKYVFSYIVNDLVEMVSSDFLDECNLAINHEYDIILDSISEGITEIEFICETNKNPFEYELNDEVIFTVYTLFDNKLISIPFCQLKYTDDMGNRGNVIVDSSCGFITYSHEGISTPGEAMLSVTPLNENKEEFNYLDEAGCVAGVIYDFRNLKTHSEKPDDFDEFWNSKIEEILSHSTSEIFCEECQYLVDDNYDIYCVGVDTGYSPSYAHISVPKNATPNSLSIVICFQSAGMPESVGYKTNDNAITVYINRNSVENHKTNRYYNSYHDSIGEGFLYDCETKDKNECYFMDLIIRDIQTLRYTEEKFNDLWNKEDIIATGGSMGGFQTVVVSALYSKVTEVIIRYPWVCDLKANFNSRRIPNGNILYTKTSRYFDACYFAPRFTGKVTIESGFGDTDCSINTVTALYNSYDNCSYKIFYGKQLMGHVRTGWNNETYVVEN